MSIGVIIAAALAATGPQEVGDFAGNGPIPAPWRLIRLNKNVPPTSYRQATIDGVGAIEANANSSMALLARPIAIDLAATPILCWRWRVDAPVAAADMSTKKGDDYAARLYVAFDISDSALGSGTRFKLSLARRLFGQDLPDAALNYVWDNRNPIGTEHKSAYTDRAQLIVAETGEARARRWVSERADIAADYARAFPGQPGQAIQLAIASDTDNTHSRARAAFADIHFVARKDRC
ncbi:MAG: DUF3047 domain-containing protein [Sphingomicrobium sp.]